MHSLEATLEIIHSYEPRGRFRAALFDFDGTISLLRAGWQDVMIPYFTEVLLQTPGTRGPSEEARYVTEYVRASTGVQTIYQCMELARQVQKRGGSPLDPLEYKSEYNRRLLARIVGRLKALQSGQRSPDDFLVPGSLQLLRKLRERGLALYLASGTDREYVRAEAAALGVASFFNGGIHGALRDYKRFSKAIIVERMINEQDLAPAEILGFGDGPVEIESVRNAGGLAVGVAADERHRGGLSDDKRHRLIKAGAHLIVPHYQHGDVLMSYLFPDTC